MIRMSALPLVVLCPLVLVAACSDSTDPDRPPAAVTGTVTDTSGAPVADAAVVLDMDFRTVAPVTADKPRTGIVFDLPEPATYEVRITDVCDDQVFFALADSAAPGAYMWLWDGRDGDGLSLVEGFFHAHILIEGRDPVVKTIALARNPAGEAGDFAVRESADVRANWRIAAWTDADGRFRITRDCWEFGETVDSVDETGGLVGTLVAAPRIRAWAYAADRTLGASSGWIDFDGTADATADIVFGEAEAP